MSRTARLRTLTTIVALAMGVVAAAPLRAEGAGTAAAGGTAPAQSTAAPATAAVAVAAPAAASAAPAAGVQTATATVPKATAEPAAAGGGAPTAVKDGAERASGLNALWSGLRALPELARGSTAGSSSASKATVDNPYGIDALWRGSDVVTKGALVILLLMSAGSWYVMFTKLFEQFKLGRQARAANKTFWDAGALPLAIDTLHHKSAFHYIARSGLDATERHEGLLGHIDLNTWVNLSIQRSIEHVQSRLQDGLALLATVGSTAPFVGLFGTVWGIYHALTAIGIAGQASIDKVAGPVGEALIMTAIGLAVAVPAVLGYNLLVRRNRAALERVRAFGSELHAVVLGSAGERPPVAKPQPTYFLRAVSN